MGWSSEGATTKDELIRRITADWEDDGCRGRCLCHCVLGDVVWSVWEKVGRAGQPNRTIVCGILESFRGVWMHKPVDEAMHPYYFDCPLNFLDMAPVACEDWRKMVRLWHLRKAQDEMRWRDR